MIPKSKIENSGTSGVDTVLADAQTALNNAKRRVRTLHRSIRFIKTKIDRGDPVPEFLSVAKRR
jgi:hypothetical protein